MLSLSAIAGGLLAFLAPAPAPEVDSRESTRILRDAARLIRNHGHQKFILGDPVTGFCVHGAINYAATGKASWPFRSGLPVSKAWCEATKRLATYLGDKASSETIPETGEVIGHGVYWNNAPERTKAEVIRALEAA